MRPFDRIVRTSIGEPAVTGDEAVQPVRAKPEVRRWLSTLHARGAWYRAVHRSGDLMRSVVAFIVLLAGVPAHAGTLRGISVDLFIVYSGQFEGQAGRYDHVPQRDGLPWWWRKLIGTRPELPGES